MKMRCVRQVVIIGVVMILATVFSASVFAEETIAEMGVAYRGHVQNKGNVPQLDNTYIDGPTELGTRGAGLRIEGFQFKLTGTMPEGMEIRYNVHVQNKGWLYCLDDPSTWAKDGEFAGTRGECLRIEAIKIVLLDANGDASNGYSVLYRGHIQNMGNLPAAADDWLKDGAPLGTTGSGLRLEAIQVKILKTDSSPELEAYQALVGSINGLTEKDYTPNTWAELQTVIAENTVTFEGNTVKEIKAATAAIQSAYDKLVVKEPALIYDTPGIYGPTSGTQVVNGDVIVKADGVTLQNLQINGDLIISEQKTTEKTEEIVTEMNDDQIMTKGVTFQVVIFNPNVAGNVLPRYGTGIVFTGNQLLQLFFALQDGSQFSATMAAGSGAPMDVTIGSGGMVTFGGTVGSLNWFTSSGQLSLLPGCMMQQLTVSQTAPNCQVTTSTTSQIYNLAIQGSGANIKGQGQIDAAQILANGVVFEKRPNEFNVGSGVTIQPNIPDPPSPDPPSPDPPQPQEPGNQQPGNQQPGNQQQGQ